MRNKKIAAYICMGLLLMTAGCGNSDSDSYVSKTDTINFNYEDIEKNSSNDQTDEDVEKNSNNDQTDEDVEKTTVIFKPMKKVLIVGKATRKTIIYRRMTITRQTSAKMKMRIILKAPMKILR